MARSRSSSRPRRSARSRPGSRRSRCRPARSRRPDSRRRCRSPAAASPPRSAAGDAAMRLRPGLGIALARRGARRARRARRRRRLAQPARRRHGSRPAPAARRRQRRARRARRVPRPRRQLHQLPHRARRRALRRRPGDRDAVRHRLRVQPHARSATPASAAGRPTSSGAPCTTAARATGGCSIRRSRIRTTPASSRADADAMFAYLQSLPAVAQPNRAHALRFPFDHAGGARGLARALLPAGGPCRRPGALGRMEPRRLPGRGPRPLQRLPLARATRSARPAARSTCRRPDPGAELVRAFAGVAAEAGVADWPKHEVVAAAQDRRRAARLRAWGRWARWSLEQHPVPERRRPGGDGGLPAGAAAADRDAPRRPAQRRRPPSARGAALYEDHCVACHGERGEGVPAPIRRWPATGR